MTKSKRTAREEKVKVRIRFDADVIAGLRKTGRGWQTRLNNLAKAALGLTESAK